MKGVRFSEDDLRKNPRYRHLVSGAAKSGKPSKYHNVITTTPDGTFDSAKEAQRFGALKLLEKAGEITGIARQVRFRLSVRTPAGVQHIDTYVADFVYFSIPERMWIAEDYKGFRTRDYLRKKRLMLELYGIQVLETCRE